MGASLRPQLGFLGLGWIGQLRLRALVEADVADVVAICDPRTESTLRVAADLPGVRSCASLEDLLEQRVDGIVIATPSALHSSQAITCLNSGRAVFCQKPLARSRDEAVRVVDAANRANRLLSVDMSYRFAAAVLALKRLMDTGGLGVVHTADLVFHNGYGPDQPWYYARDLAGGGCLMDLGVHLIDQVVWLLGWSDPRVVDARLLHQGQPWDRSAGVEDFAHVLLEGPGGAVARVVCSWRAPAGCDARIGVELIGTDSGARLSNVAGSFYDFVAEQWQGTRSSILAAPPDAWGGRALVAWAQALAEGRGYDPGVEQQIALSGILDRIYAAAEYRGGVASA